MAVKKNPPNNGSRRSTSFSQTSGASSSQRLNKTQMQQVYRRRRIVALGIIVIVICVIVGGIWGISRVIKGSSSTAASGSSSVSSTSQSSSSSKESASAQSSKSSSTASATPTTQSDKSKRSGIPDCTASNLNLALSTNDATTYEGGSITFTITITHKGSTDCLVDASSSSTVLVIKSADTTVYRSDACDADSKMLLMSESQSYKQSITWGGKANNGTACETTDSSVVTAGVGTYSAYATMADDESAVSDPVTITISR